jgi:hypothetical protein
MPNSPQCAADLLLSMESRGHACLRAAGPADCRGEGGLEGRAGDLLLVPDSRHALEALEDSVILLTVSKAVPAGQR